MFAVKDRGGVGVIGDNASHARSSQGSLVHYHNVLQIFFSSTIHYNQPRVPVFSLRHWIFAFSSLHFIDSNCTKLLPLSLVVAPQLCRANEFTLDISCYFYLIACSILCLLMSFSTYRLFADTFIQPAGQFSLISLISIILLISWRCSPNTGYFPSVPFVRSFFVDSVTVSVCSMINCHSLFTLPIRPSDHGHTAACNNGIKSQYSFETRLSIQPKKAKSK